jgi:hypothetical protein
MAEQASKLLERCEFKVFEEETHTSLPFKQILTELLKL